MVISTQKIQIILEYITKGVARANAQAQKANQGINQQQVAAQKLTGTQKLGARQMESSRLAQSGFTKVMGMSQQNIKEFNQQGYRFATVGGRIANRMRMATHGLRGFRMEMLGTMFFGMMLYRTFSGLLRVSLEWVGVNELMTASLGILFLPVAEWVLEWATKFLDWVLRLTESQKKWIGSLVILGAALGGALFILGTFALGIGSVILALGALVSPIGLVIAGFIALAGFFILKDYFGGVAEASDKLNESMMGMGIPPELIEKAKGKLGELIEVIKGKIREISDDVKLWKDAGLKIIINVLSGITEYLKSNPLIIVGAIIGGLIGGPAGVAVGGAIGGLFGRLDLEKRNEIIDKGLEILRGILDGLMENIDIIEDFIITLIAKLGEWIGKNADKLLGLGLKIAGSIMEGMIKGALRIGGEFMKTVLAGLTGKPRGAFLGIPEFQYGGIVPGRLGTPMPILAHAGERITPAGGAASTGTIIINAEYNVVVSDKREFESMLRENNIKLAEDVRRIVKV